MKTHTYIFIITLIFGLNILSSCASRNYPCSENWLVVNQESTNKCSYITGSYKDIGTSSYAQDNDPRLSKVLYDYLFYDVTSYKYYERFKDVNLTEISISCLNELEIYIYDSDSTLIYQNEKQNIEDKCTKEGLFLSYGPRYVFDEQIFITWGNILLTQDKDGSLLCKTTYHLVPNFFCIIPFGHISRSCCYKFESTQ